MSRRSNCTHEGNSVSPNVQLAHLCWLNSTAVRKRKRKSNITDGQTDEQTNRQTDRQADRQTNRQTQMVTLTSVGHWMMLPVGH